MSDQDNKPQRRTPISAYLRRPLRSWQEAARDRALREQRDAPAPLDPTAAAKANSAD